MTSSSPVLHVRVQQGLTPKRYAGMAFVLRPQHLLLLGVSLLVSFAPTVSKLHATASRGHIFVIRMLFTD